MLRRFGAKRMSCAVAPCATTGEFHRAWREAFRPATRMGKCVRVLRGRGTATRISRFRLARGAITYWIKFAIAAETVASARRGERIREKNYRSCRRSRIRIRSILCLLEITRPVEATGEWLQTKRDGRLRPARRAGPRATLLAWSAIFSSRFIAPS